MSTNATRKLARGGALNFIGLVYYGLANLVLVVVISRELGPSSAGVLLTTIAVFNIVQRALLLGADLGLVRTISRWLAVGRRRDVEHLWTPVGVPLVFLSLVAGAAIWTWAEPLARLVGDRDIALTAQLRAVAPILPCAVIYQALEAASRGYGTFFPSFVVEKVGKVTLQLGAVGFLASQNARPRYLALGWALPFVLGAVVLFVWVQVLQRNSRGEHRVHGDDDLVPEATMGRVAGEFWRFSAPRAPAGVFQSAQLWSDSVLVGALAAGATASGSTTAAGIYSAGTRFLIIASFVQLAIGQALQPLISAALARRDDGTAQSVFQASTGWTVLFTWPVLIGIMGFAPALLGIYGDEYRAASSALVVLGAAWLVATGCGAVDSVLLMSGRSAMTTINSGVAVALNISLSFLLIPDHGMLGAAIAWGVSLVWNNVMPLLQVRHYLHMAPWGPSMRRVIVPLAAYSAVIVGARAAFGATLIVAAGAAVVGLIVFVALVRPRRDALQLAELAAGLRRRRTPGANAVTQSDAARD